MSSIDPDKKHHKCVSHKPLKPSLLPIIIHESSLIHEPKVVTARQPSAMNRHYSYTPQDLEQAKSPKYKPVSEKTSFPLSSSFMITPGHRISVNVAERSLQPSNSFKSPCSIDMPISNANSDPFSSPSLGFEPNNSVTIDLNNRTKLADLMTNDFDHDDLLDETEDHDFDFDFIDLTDIEPEFPTDRSPPLGSLRKELLASYSVLGENEKIHVNHTEPGHSVIMINVDVCEYLAKTHISAIKHGKSGKPHSTFVSLSSNYNYIEYVSKKKQGDGGNVVRVEWIREIRLGQKTNTFHRNRDKRVEHLSLSIIYSKPNKYFHVVDEDVTEDNKPSSSGPYTEATLDLIVEDPNEFIILLKSLQMLKSARENRLLYNAMEQGQINKDFVLMLPMLSNYPSCDNIVDTRTGLNLTEMSENIQAQTNKENIKEEGLKCRVANASIFESYISLKGSHSNPPMDIRESITDKRNFDSNSNHSVSVQSECAATFMDQSDIVDVSWLKQMVSAMPKIARNMPWKKVYSMSENGAGYFNMIRALEKHHRTLDTSASEDKYSRNSPERLRNISLLILKTNDGDIIGCGTCESWRSELGFYGNGESVIFVIDHIYSDAVKIVRKQRALRESLRSSTNGNGQSMFRRSQKRGSHSGSAAGSATRASKSGSFCTAGHETTNDLVTSISSDSIQPHTDLTTFTNTMNNLTIGGNCDVAASINNDTCNHHDINNDLTQITKCCESEVCAHNLDPCDECDDCEECTPAELCEECASTCLDHIENEAGGALLAQLHAYRWMPENHCDLFMYTTLEGFGIGGGEPKPQIDLYSPLSTLDQEETKITEDDNGGAAIFISKDMMFGDSKPCGTFNSPSLTSTEKWGILMLELWSPINKY